MEDPPASCASVPVNSSTRLPTEESRLSSLRLSPLPLTACIGVPQHFRLPPILNPPAPKAPRRLLPGRQSGADPTMTSRRLAVEQSEHARRSESAWRQARTRDGAERRRQQNYPRARRARDGQTPMPRRVRTATAVAGHDGGRMSYDDYRYENGGP